MNTKKIIREFFLTAGIVIYGVIISKIDFYQNLLLSIFQATYDSYQYYLDNFSWKRYNFLSFFKDNPIHPEFLVFFIVLALYALIRYVFWIIKKAPNRKNSSIQKFKKTQIRP